MSGFLSVNIIQTALEIGLIYALVALSLFISFSILDICDLSTDGCYTLGCAVGAMVTIAGHPVLALVAAVFAGVCSGFVTAFLQTRLKVPSILAGIIVNTGLYTINLAVMGFSSNLSLFGKKTGYMLFRTLSDSEIWRTWHKLIFMILLITAVIVFIRWFMGTHMGLAIRATGDCPSMIKASSVNPVVTITVGLCIANGLTGLAGGLIGQYNKSADINLGTGMVTIALASLIIGETISRKKNMLPRIVCVVIGSVLYRFIISIALSLNVPTEAFKLVSAIIVAVAIAAPQIKGFLSYQKKKRDAIQFRKNQIKGEN